MPTLTQQRPAEDRTREVVLSLSGINKRFGAVQALTDVSLEVGAGEVVALVGDNGAGNRWVRLLVCAPGSGDGARRDVPGPARPAERCRSPVERA